MYGDLSRHTRATVDFKQLGKRYAHTIYGSSILFQTPLGVANLHIFPCRLKRTTSKSGGIVSSGYPYEFRSKSSILVLTPMTPQSQILPQVCKLNTVAHEIPSNADRNVLGAIDIDGRINRMSSTKIDETPPTRPLHH